MAPKSKKNLPIALKFKRQAQTVFVSATPRETWGVMVGRLCDMVNGTGGLRPRCDPKSLEEADGPDGNGADSGDVELPDIDIPKPSFDTASSDDESDNDGESNGDDDIATDDTVETAKGNGGAVQLSANQLKFALPKELSDIYKGGFEEVAFSSGAKIETLPVEDFSVVAFALTDEPFEIAEAVAEAEQ